MIYISIEKIMCLDLVKYLFGCCLECIIIIRYLFLESYLNYFDIVNVKC